MYFSISIDIFSNNLWTLNSLKSRLTYCIALLPLSDKSLRVGSKVAKIADSRDSGGSRKMVCHQRRSGG